MDQFIDNIHGTLTASFVATCRRRVKAGESFFVCVWERVPNLHGLFIDGGSLQSRKKF